MRHTAPHSLLLTYNGSGTPPPVAPAGLHDAEGVTKQQPISVGPAASRQSLSGAHVASAAKFLGGAAAFSKISPASQGGGCVIKLIILAGK